MTCVWVSVWCRVCVCVRLFVCVLVLLCVCAFVCVCHWATAFSMSILLQEYGLWVCAVVSVSLSWTHQSGHRVTVHHVMSETECHIVRATLRASGGRGQDTGSVLSCSLQLAVLRQHIFNTTQPVCSIPQWEWIGHSIEHNSIHRFRAYK